MAHLVEQRPEDAVEPCMKQAKADDSIHNLEVALDRRTTRLGEVETARDEAYNETAAMLKERDEAIARVEAMKRMAESLEGLLPFQEPPEPAKVLGWLRPHTLVEGHWVFSGKAGGRGGIPVQDARLPVGGLVRESIKKVDRHLLEIYSNAEKVHYSQVVEWAKAALDWLKELDVLLAQPAPQLNDDDIRRSSEASEQAARESGDEDQLKWDRLASGKVTSAPQPNDTAKPIHTHPQPDQICPECKRPFGEHTPFIRREGHGESSGCWDYSCPRERQPNDAAKLKGQIEDLKYAWKTTDDLRNRFLLERDEAKKELAEARARVSVLQQLGKQRDDELASDLADMKCERDDLERQHNEAQAGLCKLRQVISGLYSGAEVGDIIRTPIEWVKALAEACQRAELAESKLAAALALTDEPLIGHSFGLIKKIRSTLLDGSQTP